MAQMGESWTWPKSIFIKQTFRSQDVLRYPSKLGLNKDHQNLLSGSPDSIGFLILTSKFIGHVFANQENLSPLFPLNARLIF